jgi:hypothetical protein
VHSIVLLQLISCVLRASAWALELLLLRAVAAALAPWLLALDHKSLALDRSDRMRNAQN